MSIMLSEPQIYGREAGSFNFTYRHLSNQLFTFPLGGLWRRTGEFGKWAQSIPQVRDARGRDNERFRASDDAIVDLCLTSAARVNQNTMKGGVEDSIQASILRSSRFPPDTPWYELMEALGTPDVLPSDSNYIDYQIVLIIEEKNWNAHFRLPPLSGPQIFEGGPLAINEIPELSSVVQSLNTPSFWVRLEGSAIRVGEPVQPPVFERYGNGKCVPDNDPDKSTYFKHGLVGWTSHPIYAAKWNLRWIVANGNFTVTQPTGELPPPPIPPTFQGFTNGQN
jgi:hypothetical protein